MLERSYIGTGPLSANLAANLATNLGGNISSASPKRSLVFTLTLTSLIDAFVIIVIYLLVNFGNPTSFNPSGKVELPGAVQTDQLVEGAVITIKDGHYFILNREVPFGDVPRQLYELAQKANFKLIIEADKNTSYDALSPIIQAGSQAGFHQFKFAVLQKDQGGIL